MSNFANGLNGTLSLDTDGTSSIYTISSPSNVGSIQLVWTGTPTGSIYLQKSVDLNNWIDVGMSDNDDTNYTKIDLSGSADSEIVFIHNCTFPFLRIKYVSTSGEGDLSFYIVIKSTTSSVYHKSIHSIFTKPEGRILSWG